MLSPQWFKSTTVRVPSLAQEHLHVAGAAKKKKKKGKYCVLLVDLKGEIDNSTVRARNVNTPFLIMVEHQFNIESGKDHSWIIKSLGEICWKIKYTVSKNDPYISC